MKTWIMVRRSDLEIMGHYMAEEKDDTSANRNYSHAEPVCKHMELPEEMDAECVDCEMQEDEMTLVHSEAKEAAQLERAWDALRSTRDSKLAETDKYVLSDYPISAENLIAMKAYRNDLRDLPGEVADPRMEIEWPEMPEV